MTAYNSEQVRVKMVNIVGSHQLLYLSLHVLLKDSSRIFSFFIVTENILIAFLHAQDDLSVQISDIASSRMHFISSALGRFSYACCEITVLTDAIIGNLNSYLL